MDLRTIIRQIIKESYEALNELQKGPQFDLYTNFTMSNLSPEVPEGKYDDINIMKEVNRQLKAKLGRVFIEQYEFPNFYIVRLGNFVLKTNAGEEKLSFIKKGEENIRYSYPYLYVYQDKAEVLKFGSRFFESDEILIKNAQEYIKGKKINLITKTQSGTIEINNQFDQDNIIDLVDWSKVDRPAPEKLTPKEKNQYRVGQPFSHKLYGKGVIAKTKFFGEDETGKPLFDVSVNFNGKEKKFRVGKKAA